MSAPIDSQTYYTLTTSNPHLTLRVHTTAPCHCSNRLAASHLHSQLMHLHTPSPARAGDEDEDHLAPHFADALNTASSVANSASRLNRLSGITLNNDIPTSPSSSYPELHHHSSLVFGPYASNPSSGTTPAAISSPLLYDDSFEASVPSALNSKPGKFRSKLKRIIELFRPAPMTQDQLETMLRI